MKFPRIRVSVVNAEIFKRRDISQIMFELKDKDCRRRIYCYLDKSCGSDRALNDTIYSREPS
jgi:hypothetical protein